MSYIYNCLTNSQIKLLLQSMFSEIYRTINLYLCFYVKIKVDILGIIATYEYKFRYLKLFTP